MKAKELIIQVFLISFVLFTGLSGVLNAQKLTYQIFMGRDSIGLMRAEHKINGNSHHFELKSNMSIKTLVQVELQYILTADFEKEKLMNSFTEQDVNGRIKVSSSARWDGKHYIIQTLEKREKMKNTVISYNLATLYFREPVNIRKVYSDTHGRFLTIRPAGQHIYELILPDGKKNTYHYQFGICTEVEINQLFSKVYFRLINN